MITNKTDLDNILLGRIERNLSRKNKIKGSDCNFLSQSTTNRYEYPITLYI